MTNKELLRKILNAKAPNHIPVKFVAVDGFGGAGKTVLAQILSKKLDAEIIQTDDFASYDNPLDWWGEMVEKVFEPVKSGAKSLKYSKSSWYKNRKPITVKQKVTPIMIIEGVSASRIEFRPYLAYSIWVETPPAICIKRGVDRDKKNLKGQTEVQILANWQKWHAYELDYVNRDNPKENADIIIDGTKDYE